MTKLQEPIGRVAESSVAARQNRRQGNPKRHPIAWVLALLALAGAVLVGWHFYSSSNAGNTVAGAKAGMANRPTPVVAAIARKGDMNLYLTGLGNVIPFNTVTVRSRVDGQIDKIDFKEGQIVKEGDVLFEIDPRPFQVQLATAEGQMARDQALLHNAQLNVQRDQEAKDAISQQQLSTDTATAEQAAASAKIDQAAIDTANLQLTYARITAPISGRIGLKIVDKGNMIHATDQTGLAVITQLQPISVVFSLPEDNLLRVQNRMRAGALPVDAYARDLTTKLSTGTLAAMDNQIDPNSATFRLKATFSNEDYTLFPNQFINARLQIEARHDAVTVPSAAIQRSPDSVFVYTVKQDPAATTDANGPKHGTVELQKISLGPTEGDSTIISEGITAGDVVVTDGVDKLQPGGKVVYTFRADAGSATQPAGASSGGERRHRRDANSSSGGPSDSAAGGATSRPAP